VDDRQVAMRFENRFEEAFASATPIEALRTFAIELGAAGYTRQQIYELFQDYDVHLQRMGREAESTVMFDVLDMISGWYASQNLNLPDDESS
jgi:hypothetical protein